MPKTVKSKSKSKSKSKKDSGKKSSKLSKKSSKGKLDKRSKKDKPAESSSPARTSSAGANGSVPAGNGAGNEGTTLLYNKVEQMRQTLQKMIADSNAAIEEAIKNLENNSEIEKAKKESTELCEKAIADLEKTFNANVENVKKELNNQMNEELEMVKITQNLQTNAPTKKMKSDMELLMDQKEKDYLADVEAYKRQKENELNEQIKHLKAAFEQDLSDYTLQHKTMLRDMIEQIKVRFKLETANIQQREDIDAKSKAEEITKRFHALQNDRISKLNSKLVEQTSKAKDSADSELGMKIKEIQNRVKSQAETMRKQMEEKARQERAPIESELTGLLSQMNAQLKMEERRLDIKKDLLAIGKMDDCIKLTEEEFIETKHGYTIARNQIIFQNNRASVYNARYGQKGYVSKSAVCVVIVKSQWSVRHREEFAKSATKVARYVSQQMLSNTKQYKNLAGKSPSTLNIPFLRLAEVFMTDSKVYIFYDSYANNQPLEVVLQAHKNSRKSESENGTSGLNREEITNILWQMLNGITYLNRMFIAHSNINLEHVIVSCQDDDLSNAKVFLGGLTRPLIFYNVEFDKNFDLKGFDYAAESAMIEFYPPEAFAPEFNPSTLDIYSWAIVACYLVRLRSPFPKSQKDQQRKLIAHKADVPVSIQVPNRLGGSNLEQCITSSTNPNPKVRSQPEELLGHPFFTSFSA